MRKTILLLLLLVLGWTLLWAQQARIQFVFTSDLHYGITRPAFRGNSDVDSQVVNRALVAQINRIPEAVFPNDGGNGADQLVGSFDFMAIGGDVANRAEVTETNTIQSAAKSWSQFRMDYIDGLKLHDRAGAGTPLYVVPGNHDVSNAIGSYKPMKPAIDKTALAEIYNLMLRPPTLKTMDNLDYPGDKMLVSHDIGGMHFVFITLWPDSSVRAWMENDLKNVSAGTPVIIFAHDPPEGDAKHFINPGGKHDMNQTDQYENLLSDQFTDMVTERRSLEAFLLKHPNITAYFHGHNNWNQFYDWTGPDNAFALHTFRVDSPMKGRFSSADEKKLSYQIATIDTAARTMTVREVLWNANPNDPNSPVIWGGSTTVALSPHSSK
jgi:3',5'-cyclic AMP phosphodiesterase CpdA